MPVFSGYSCFAAIGNDFNMWGNETTCRQRAFAKLIDYCTDMTKPHINMPLPC